MRRCSLLFCCLSLLAMTGCGNDDDDSEKVSASVRELCQTQADRGEECGFFDGEFTRKEFIEFCGTVQENVQKSCMASASDLEACRKAYEKQTCDEVEGAEIPDACVVMCQQSR